MKINSSTRLLASEDWWDSLTSDQKKLYIKQHPNSKYAKQHIVDDEEEGGPEQAPAEEDVSKNNKPEETKEAEDKPKSPEAQDRRTVADTFRKLAPKVAEHLKKAFPRINAAGAALKRIASGHELEEEHKEVLHELGSIALKTLSSHLTGSPHLAKVVSSVGTHAIEYSIEKFKEHKEQNKNKDDIEVFIDGVAEGMEHADPEKKEDKALKSAGSIGQHIKKSAGHIVEVLNRSFKEIKPATQGLVGLAQGKPLDHEQKKAIRGLGKVALATSIAALPGGLAVHLGAGIGASALQYAFKKMKGSTHNGHGILHHFVESIGEGLEDALLESAAGEGGE